MTATTLCPFCSADVDIELYDGGYGCDSGCSYVTFEVECPSCARLVYKKGEFGEIDNSYPDDTEEAWREHFMQEFAEEVRRINAQKLIDAEKAKQGLL